MVCPIALVDESIDVIIYLQIQKKESFKISPLFTPLPKRRQMLKAFQICPVVLEKKMRNREHQQRCG